MPKVDGPLYGETATGEIAGVIGFKDGKRWPRIERKRKPKRWQTSAQEIQQAAFFAAKQSWLALSSSEKEVWNSAAAPGETGYRNFIKSILAPITWAFGNLILGQDIINQGSPPPVPQSADYKLNFPVSIDTIPVLVDQTEGSWAFELNNLVIFILSIEAYLIFYKANIEGS